MAVFTSTPPRPKPSVGHEPLAVAKRASLTQTMLNLLTVVTVATSLALAVFSASTRNPFFMELSAGIALLAVISTFIMLRFRKESNYLEEQLTDWDRNN